MARLMVVHLVAEELAAVRAGRLEWEAVVEADRILWAEAMMDEADAAREGQDK